ncbi:MULTISPECIES: hypothetical protein [Kitasatospora]|jgi:hypothetical protein|uniref:Uncharacterized protein n=1 Tax=Kitasatospora arboriphila TaxID=258052 RepID=A0ABP4DXF7_9ACTN
MTFAPKHRNDPTAQGTATAPESHRLTGRQLAREPHGLISHWYPHEQLAQQMDVYA